MHCCTQPTRLYILLSLIWTAAFGFLCHFSARHNSSICTELVRGDGMIKIDILGRKNRNLTSNWDTMLNLIIVPDNSSPTPTLHQWCLSIKWSVCPSIHLLLRYFLFGIEILSTYFLSPAEQDSACTLCILPQLSAAVWRRRGVRAHQLTPTHTHAPRRLSTSTQQTAVRVERRNDSSWAASRAAAREEAGADGFHARGLRWRGWGGCWWDGRACHHWDGCLSTYHHLPSSSLFCLTSSFRWRTDKATPMHVSTSARSMHGWQTLAYPPCIPNTHQRVFLFFCGVAALASVWFFSLAKCTILVC